MTKSVKLAVVTAAALSLLTASANAATTTKSTKEKTTKEKTTTAAAGVSSADKHFVESAHNINLEEVKLGDLAQQKSQNNDVKSFASKLVNDHNQADSSLKQWAEGKSITLANDVDANAKRTFDRLNKMSGEQFDKQYVNTMVAGHKKAVALFQGEERRTNESDLKSWTSNTLKTIEQHLKDAEELSKNISKSSNAKSGTEKKEHAGKKSGK